MGVIFKYGEPFSNTIKTRQLKQAEYDALSVAEKCNNTFYFITDANGEDGSFQPVIYSEEEREVGVWVDGKPLYEKTLNLTFTANEQKQIGTGYGAAFIKNVFFEYTASSGRWMSQHIFSSYALSSSKFIHSEVTNGTLYLYFVSNAATTGALITIQYTKQSDAPGSGTWTPQGVPAVHYSTDEKVVGTWIDGSTIYEITDEFTSAITINSGAWANTEIANANINRIIDITAYSSTGTLWRCLGGNRDIGDYVQILNTRSSAISVSAVTIRYTKSSS